MPVSNPRGVLVCALPPRDPLWMSQPQILLDSVRDGVRAKHYSLRTEEAYVSWIRRSSSAKKHPSAMGTEEVNQFLTSLAVERKVSAVDAESGTECNPLSIQSPLVSPARPAASPHAPPPGSSRRRRILRHGPSGR
ncbi:MAG TPA: phage integrase N-terminal SAM-like domain-containing protein [Thermoanaerobaculia bacterium]|nr:phage integrase N-terminal SAM-like domain-containing protein [Thermoanaerobaculia bacterium]